MITISVADAFGPLSAGIAAGLIAALWLSKFLASQLFHTTPRDPITIAATIAFLMAACAVAIVVPMRRATRIDAAEALRSE